jgi:hypothetical protein
MANASMLPLAAGTLAHTKDADSPLVISALIIVPQVIVVLMAPWVGYRAKTWGRRPLLLAGFAALPVRAHQWHGPGRNDRSDNRRCDCRLETVQSGAGLCRDDVRARSFNQPTLVGQLVGGFGHTAAFMSIAAVSLTAVLLFWLMMPETSSLANSRPAAR